MNIRAVGYVRVSTIQQASEEKVSLDIQETDIGSHCDSRGHTLLRIYKDIGSGASKNRPDFKRMLRDARNGEFDVIVAWKSDRLSRGLYPATALMEALEGTLITLEAVKDAIDLKTFGLLAAVGKIELESIRERCQMGAKGRARKGKTTGRVRYGYQSDEEGFPQIAEEKAEVVRRIFQLYLEGLSFDRITDKLNDEGVPAPAGNIWWSTTVGSILKDTVYYSGTKEWGLRRPYTYNDSAADRDRTRVRMIPEEDSEGHRNWVDVPYKPIIDPEIFTEVQRLMKHHLRVHNGSLSKVEMPLKGLLWCSEHGRFYGVSRYRDPKSNKIYRYYVCDMGTHASRNQGKCSQPKINSDRIEERVTHWLTEFLSNPIYWKKMKEEVQERLDSGAVGVLNQYRQRAISIEEERRRLVISQSKGYMSEAELDLDMRRINEQKDYFEEAIQRLEGELGDQEYIVKTLAVVDEHHADLLPHLAYLAEEDAASFYRKYVKELTVVDLPSPDDLQCVFKLGNLAATTLLPQGKG